MGHPDHLALLKQGTKVWNAWRRINRSLRPDLSGDPLSDLEHQISMLAAAVANEVMPGKAPADEGELSGIDLAVRKPRRPARRNAHQGRAACGK
jgi:hypothetical protein